MTSAIVIRGRKSGDRLRIKERGLSKTLKKLYSENKLPQSLREINPIIADDEGVVFVNGFEPTKGAPRIITAKKSYLFL